MSKIEEILEYINAIRPISKASTEERKRICTQDEED